MLCLFLISGGNVILTSDQGMITAQSPASIISDDNSIALTRDLEIFCSFVGSMYKHSDYISLECMHACVHYWLAALA